MLAAGTISREKSKSRFAKSVVLIVLTGPHRRSVDPSGGARTTILVARLPLSPGWFSTQTDCLSLSESQGATRRAEMSIGPPAGNPTRRRIGPVGYSGSLGRTWSILSEARRVSLDHNRPRCDCALRPRI